VVVGAAAAVNASLQDRIRDTRCVRAQLQERLKEVWRLAWQAHRPTFRPVSTVLKTSCASKALRIHTIISKEQNGSCPSYMATCFR
jgi:hypothetical protein